MPHLTEDTDALLARVYVGASTFVVFPTRRTVVAVNTSGSRRWLPRTTGYAKTK